MVFGTPPGRTEPTLAPRNHRHGLARAQPDSPAFRPLHSATRTALQATRTFRCVPTDRKLPRQAKTTCAPEEAKWPRCSAYRPRPAIIVRAASFRSVSAPKSLPLRETVRPHSKNRQWADTSAISLRARLRCSPCCPCRTSPDAPPDGRGVSINGRALSRRARTNPGHAKLNFGSAGGLSCRMLPGGRTRDVICKAAPMPYPAGA